MATLGYLIEHTASILRRQSDQVLQERLGIGLSQFKLLMMLQEVPGAQQRALAYRLGQTEASVSRQIRLLYEKGMLATKVNPKNRRQHLIAATVRGVKMTQAARDVLEHYHAPVFSQLSEKQQKQLLETLRSIHAETCRAGKPHACDCPDGL